MAIRTFKEEELVEIKGMKVEKEWAIPNTTEQNAIMLVWNPCFQQWEISVWGAGVDSQGVCAYGWEPIVAKPLEEMIETHLKPLMQTIEKDTLVSEEECLGYKDCEECPCKKHCVE